MQLNNCATLLLYYKIYWVFSHFLDNIVKISYFYIYAKFNWCAYT